MQKQSIEQVIGDVLTGDAQKRALDFTAYLSASEMLFEKGKGYWEDKHYWMIKYQGEHVCFILINGSEDNSEPEGWTIWSDDSDSKWFETLLSDEHMMAVAWRNVDICANCGGCKNPGGTRKKIFGTEFDNVCITTMKFMNPDADELKCAINMVDLRKNEILNRTYHA